MILCKYCINVDLLDCNFFFLIHILRLILTLMGHHLYSSTQLYRLLLMEGYWCALPLIWQFFVAPMEKFVTPSTSNIVLCGHLFKGKFQLWSLQRNDQLCFVGMVRTQPRENIAMKWLWESSLPVLRYIKWFANFNINYVSLPFEAFAKRCINSILQFPCSILWVS